ncbi:MAG: 50S ribosomal protein L35ae [Candidatus Odinarchaeia archaeon]
MPKKRTPLTEIKGVGKKTEEALVKAGIKSVEDLAKFTLEKLQKKVPDISSKTLSKILTNAQDYVISSSLKEVEELKKPKKAKKTMKKKEIKKEQPEKPVKEAIKPIEVGRAYSFKKGGNRIYPQILLVNVENEKLNPDNLIGKKIWLVYSNGVKRKGKVIGTHGQRSKIRVRFERGLPAKAVGATLFLTPK